MEEFKAKLEAAPTSGQDWERSLIDTLEDHPEFLSFLIPSESKVN